MRTAGLLQRSLPAAIAILLALGGCGGCRDRAHRGDPAAFFTPRGEGLTVTLGLYSGGARVGTLVQVRREGDWAALLAGRAIEFAERVSLNMSYQGSYYTVETEQRSFFTSTFNWLGTRMSMSYGGQPWTISWERVDEELFRQLEYAGGGSREEIMRVPGRAMNMDALPLLLLKDPPRTGEGRNLRLFSALLRQTVPVGVTLVEENGPIRRFRVSLWGMEEDLWMDGNGMMVKGLLPMKMEARPAAPGERSGALALESVLTRSSIPAFNVPDDLGARPTADFLLEGLTSSPPQTAWQTVVKTGNRLELSLRKPQPPSGSREPSGSGGMARDPRLNLDSPRVQELAQTSTAGLTDPWEKALAVGHWVYHNLGKTMRECATALEVLDLEEGECQSHALLTVALLRAAKVPARFVSGVVFRPDKRAFLFHTWVEVDMGEWIPIDPTLDQFPAGVDHIPLARGEYLDQFQVFPYLFTRTGWRVVFLERKAGGPGAGSRRRD